MNELDVNLVEAWNRVVERCLKDPVETWRRARRQFRPTLTRPPRAWCMTLRASDTRIVGEWNALLDPPEADKNGEPHTIELNGWTLRKLCAPVDLPWPGMTLVEAAIKLGRSPESLRRWLPVRPGRSRETRSRQAPMRYNQFHGRLSVMYDVAQVHGHFGVDVPVVWSPGPLDPGSINAQGPHPIWGSLWQYFYKDIPEQFIFKAQRVPRYRPYLGSRRRRGWEWICPGRWNPANPDAVVEPCGRRVQVLYGPLPVVTMSHYFGTGEGFEVAEPEGGPGAAQGLKLAGRWHPGMADPLAGKRRFACGHCWRVKHFSLANFRGWNEFVSYVTGGFLYGSEVQRPDWVQYTRKVPVYTHRKKKPDVAADQPAMPSAIKPRPTVAVA